LFGSPADYDAFIQMVAEALVRVTHDPRALEGHRSRPATCSAPAGRVSSRLKRSGATAAGHTSHRLLRVPPIRLLPVPESHLRAMMPRAQWEPGRHTGWKPVLREETAPSLIHARASSVSRIRGTAINGSSG